MRISTFILQATVPDYCHLPHSHVKYILIHIILRNGFQCTDFKIDKLTPANISHADGGYVFSNISLANPFGSAVVGRIDESGNVKASFQLKQREGRRTVQYNYTFIGKR